MSRRFIIGTSDLSKSAQLKLRTYIKTKKGDWWHWIENLWLARFEDASDVSCGEIIELLMENEPSARILVMEISEDVDWSATNSTNNKGQVMTTWLTTRWPT